MSEIEKHPIIREFLELTEYKREDDHGDEEFIVNLIHAVNELPGEVWANSLSEKSQKFFNRCVKRIGKGKLLPKLPDLKTKEKKMAEAKKAKKAKKAAKAEKVAKAPKEEKVAKKASKKETKPEKKAKKTNGAAKRNAVPKDKFGLREGSAASEAASMFEKGAKMSDVKKQTGGSHYNLISKFKKDGHTVDRAEDNTITVTFK